MSRKDFISTKDYTYPLEDERVSSFPLEKRDHSKLLYYQQGELSQHHFYDLYSLLPSNSSLVFNNTRVIQARLHFQKSTGATIEVFCLEPYAPAEYNQVFQSKGSCTWKCKIGNAKKWKEGKLTKKIEQPGTTLEAQLVEKKRGHALVKFSWDDEIPFATILESAGKIPIPPYLKREAVKDDNERYQTVYSKISGSVAAPTAGLHFTEDVFDKLRQKNIAISELTLHVGAGTFQPVSTDNALEHEMHTEHFEFSVTQLENIMEKLGNITAVGTTSVRTLESLYWLGVKSKQMGKLEHFVSQWEYKNQAGHITARESLETLVLMMKKEETCTWHASTRIMIAPGYKFRLADRLITNFHQPGSTLLMLIAAFIGDDWKSVYQYALDHDFRFLSYGDSSLLVRNAEG